MSMESTYDYMSGFSDEGVSAGCSQRGAVFPPPPECKQTKLFFLFITVSEKQQVFNQEVRMLPL